MPYNQPGRMRLEGRPLPGQHLIVGPDVYVWILSNVAAAPAFAGPDLAAPLLGTPVHVNYDADWPPDKWAVVEDGIVTAQGYGEPVQPQLPAACDHVWREDGTGGWVCERCSERE
jgi:hypothetical protein